MLVLAAESQGPGVVDWLTLVVSALAVAAGVWAATVGARAERAWNEAQAATARAAEAERDAALWERDKVDQHYLNLLRALDSFKTTIGHDVVPVYVASPVGDTEAAWQAIKVAQTELMRAISETMFVARQRVFNLLPTILRIDPMVMVPIARDTGSPPIAILRMDREHQAVAQILAALPLLMRWDLGLPGPQAGEPRDFDFDEDRSLTAGLDRADDLLDLIRLYGIPQLGGGASDYIADESVFAAFRDAHPGLAGIEIGAIFTVDGRTWAFGRSSTVAPAAEVDLLRSVVRFLESGLRDGPNKRDSSFGGMFAVWSVDGRPNP